MEQVLLHRRDRELSETLLSTVPSIWNTQSGCMHIIIHTCEAATALLYEAAHELFIHWELQNIGEESSIS